MFFVDDTQHFLGLAGIGQIAGIQVTGEVDLLGVARQTHDMVALIGEPAADGPAYSCGGAGHQHTFVFHGFSFETGLYKVSLKRLGVERAERSPPTRSADAKSE